MVLQMPLETCERRKARKSTMGCKIPEVPAKGDADLLHLPARQRAGLVCFDLLSTNHSEANPSPPYSLLKSNAGE